ncbi:uncharacterized protein LOC142163402 [Nicotiana tabacum]|uniref:Uncharacterized protein LOC142163402 n=1 Tax=Nicotiana tabacum TaxID=4097 RepID=A0AC58RVN8_TOBAC
MRLSYLGSRTHLVWKYLQERFDKVNRVRIFQLHREISTISQGTDSVAAYFTKLKELWVEYDALVLSPGCDFPKSRDYIEHLHHQRLLQFLSELNESYEQAYAMIIEDESQRSNPFPALTWKADPMAMQVGRGQPYRGKKPFMQCAYCNMKGHLKENCYKLNGYPSDFKGKKKYAANSVTKNAELDKRPEGMEGGNSSEPPKFGSYFTEDQYKQILGMLNKETTNPQANMTGITICLMADVCSGEWIIDSGASHHITAYLNMLRTHTKLDSFNKDEVNLPNIEKTKITHMEIADFLDKMQDLYNGRVRGIGREEGGLYILKSDVIVVLKHFLSFVKTQFAAVLKIIRTNNGTEFFNQHYNALLDSYGILHQRSCVYTPQQNGIVERKHRHILDIARALKFQACIPARY